MNKFAAISSFIIGICFLILYIILILNLNYNSSIFIICSNLCIISTYILLHYDTIIYTKKIYISLSMILITLLYYILYYILKPFINIEDIKLYSEIFIYSINVLCCEYHAQFFKRVMTLKSIIGSLFKFILLWPFEIIAHPINIYYKLNIVMQSRFQFSVIEKSFYFIFGTFISNLYFLKLEETKNDCTFSLYTYWICFIISLFTTVFGYHKSFNAAIYSLTMSNIFGYYCILINVCFQSISSVCQSILGYYTNLPNRIVTSSEDRLTLGKIHTEFEDMTLLKAIKFGYTLNGLGDSIYSVIWGSLSTNFITAIWSSIAKEIPMLPSTILYTIAKILLTININIANILFVIASIVVSINTIVSFYIMARYRTNIIVDEINVTEDRLGLSKPNILNIITFSILFIVGILLIINLYYLFINTIICLIICSLVDIIITLVYFWEIS